MKTFRWAALVAPMLAFAVPGVAHSDSNTEMPKIEPVTMSRGELAEVDAKANKAMGLLFVDTARSERYMKAAHAILVCPDIKKGGLVIGAQSGMCVLRKGGESTSYWQTAAFSFGAQIGITEFSYALMFMNPDKLAAFENSTGIKLGADASVAVFERGVSAEVDTQNLKRDVVAFVFDESGAFMGASLEGTTFDKVDIVE